MHVRVPGFSAGKIRSVPQWDCREKFDRRPVSIASRIHDLGSRCAVWFAAKDPQYRSWLGLWRQQNLALAIL